MYELFKGPLLRLLRVPPEPEDPLGAGESLLVFRAAPNYLRYKLVTWAIGRLITIPALVATAVGLYFGLGGFEGWVNVVLVILEIGVVLLFVFNLPVSYSLVKLDYEMRWYKVTDRSLRIREGVLNVREMTMTFANIQNLSIDQGPLQRLLGIADLKVKSAGGGGSGVEQQQQQLGLDMHTGFFRGVDNAEEIRDLMRERLRALKGAGLGDPDAPPDAVIDVPTPASPTPDLAAVLTELKAEASRFRIAAERLRAP